MSALQPSVPPKLARSAWIICAIISLLILFGFSARLGVSYVVNYRANASIDAWQKSLDHKPSLDVWQTTLSSVQGMLHIDTRNPELYYTMARLYFYRARHMDESTKQALQDYKQAMQASRTVIILRPAWSYGYLNLLYSKIHAKEFDAEMTHSLLRLIKLSPWEKVNLEDIVNASVFTWSFLDVKSQRLVKSYLLLALDKRKHEVVAALKSSQYTDYFCKQIVKDENVVLCK